MEEQVKTESRKNPNEQKGEIFEKVDNNCSRTKRPKGDTTHLKEPEFLKKCLIPGLGLSLEYFIMSDSKLSKTIRIGS